MTVSVTQRLWAGFQAAENNEFLVTRNSRITYRQARDGIGRWLSAFDAAGLEAGDRVVIRTARDDVSSISFISALVDGVVPVVLEGSCPDARLNAIIDTVEPGLVLSDTEIPAQERPFQLRLLANETRSTGFSFFKSKGELAAFGIDDPVSGRPPRLPAEDDLAYLLFTSGTTSRPAGVQIRRSNLAANLNTITGLFGYDSTSRIFNDMILAHTDGMTQGPVLAAWNECSVLRAGGFELSQIEDWLGQVRQMRASHVITVPTVWSMIDQYAAHDDYFDAPECKWLMTVADKMPASLMQRLENRFSRPLANHYGLTETVASALYSGSDPTLGEVGTLGRPVDCEARVADDLEEGELQLRGDNVFPGYWRNPERTAQSFTPDGWFRTGDLVRKNADGNFKMLGRLKTVIMTGGLLIRPDEIDEALQRHPAVNDSVTVGLQDQMFGEIPVTGVTLKAETSETELTAHLRRQIEPRKVSKRIVVLPEIPRGLSGKPVLKDLKLQLQDAIRESSDETSSPATGSTIENGDEVLKIAAKVFRVPVETLSLQSHPDEVEGWDSFTHINLIFSVEAQFDVRLPAARVSAIRNIGDLIEAVEAAQ